MYVTHFVVTYLGFNLNYKLAKNIAFLATKQTNKQKISIQAFIQ